MTLETRFERVSLPLSHPFGIARGTRETAGNVLVRVADSAGNAGVGAATPSAYYGETVDTVEAVLPELLSAVEAVGDPLALARIERRLRAVAPGDRAARAAVSIAVHDLAATRLGLALYRFWGLDPERAPPTSYTVGIDDPATVRERAAGIVEAGYPVLKLKLGTDRDAELIGAVRAAAPDATVRVDANGGWDPEEALRMCDLLADHGVEFVEQPVSADDPEGLARVAERSPLPVAADESCVVPADVPAVAGWADIVNLKLSKCGGLRPARRAVHAARAAGLEVMLGCTVGSNAAIAGACHLAPAADYADLDGALLLAADPVEGPDLAGGTVRLDPDVPGTGARWTG